MKLLTLFFSNNTGSFFLSDGSLNGVFFLEIATGDFFYKTTNIKKMIAIPMGSAKLKAVIFIVCLFGVVWAFWRVFSDNFEWIEPWIKPDGKKMALQEWNVITSLWILIEIFGSMLTIAFMVSIIEMILWIAAFVLWGLVIHALLVRLFPCMREQKS